MTTYTHSLDVLALDAVLEALELPLDEEEWALALDAIRELAASYDDEPPDLAERIVGEIEKSVGLGLEEARFNSAVAAVRRILVKARLPEPPVSAPDSFLEAAYEDRFTGVANEG